MNGSLTSETVPSRIANPREPFDCIVTQDAMFAIHDETIGSHPSKKLREGQV